MTVASWEEAPEKTAPPSAADSESKTQSAMTRHPLVVEKRGPSFGSVIGSVQAQSRSPGRRKAASGISAVAEIVEGDRGVRSVMGRSEGKSNENNGECFF